MDRCVPYTATQLRPNGNKMIRRHSRAKWNLAVPTILLLIATLVVKPVTAAAKAKTESSECAACDEFRSTLNGFINFLSEHPEEKKKYPEFTIEELRRTLTAEIVPKLHVYVEKTDQLGQKRRIEVAAANYSEKWTIELNLSMWPRLVADGSLRSLIVFHEALGLLKLEKDTYPISSRGTKPYGMNHVEMPLAPAHFQVARGIKYGQSSNQGGWVRDEYHIPKRSFSLTDAEKFHIDIKQKSFTSIFVDSPVEWVIIGLRRTRY
jgi:hypothetical protein